MLKAIVFDLYETLVTERGAAVTRASGLGERFGVDPRAFRREWKGLRPSVVRGHVSFGEALSEVGRRLQTPLDPALVERVCVERTFEKRPLFEAVDSDVVSLIAELARNDLRLGVVSNGFAEDVVHWPRCAIAGSFASATFSCAVGCAKPEPEIYLHAVKALNAAPDETLYVGDGGDDELAGAERVGLRAVRAAWFVSATSDARRDRFPVMNRPGDLLRLISSGTA